MKINKTLTALIAGASIGMSGQAFSAGTTAGDDIANTVTLGYTVSGVTQDNVESDSTFKVDNKVDMTLVSQTSSSPTVPGETVTLQYTLENTGNYDLFYALDLDNNGDADHSPVTYKFYDSAILDNEITKISTTVGTPVDFWAQVTITDNANVNNGDTVEMVVLATALDPIDDTTVLLQDTSADKNAALTSKFVVFAEAASVAGGVSDGNAKQNGVITVQTDRAISTAEFTDPNSSADPRPGPTLAVEIINDVICDSGLDDTKDYSATGADEGNCPDAAAANYRPRAIPTSLAKFTYEAENSGAVTANSVTFTETLPAGYTEDSLANATLSINTASQTLTVVTATPTAQYELFIDQSGSNDIITIYLGDVPASDVINITFTAIVE